MIRLIAVNIISFIKRIFYSHADVYRIISISPALFAIGRKISLKGLLFSIFVFFLIVFNNAFDRLILYIPIILLTIFAPTFKKINFSSSLNKLIPFLILSIVYGIYQIVFGYTNFEMGWINSGISVVGADNYFITEKIRPFSFFAGVGEFAIFVSLFSYYFLLKRKYILFLFSIVIIFFIGSRGVLFTLLVVLLIIFKTKNNYQQAIKKIVLLSLIVYFLFAFIYPLYIHKHIISLFDTNSRLVVYGTFRARIISAYYILSRFEPSNLFYGINIENELFKQNLNIDNIYLRFLNDFGLISTLILLYIFVKSISNKNQLFSIGMILSYGFYNDVIPSFYLLFNLAFVYFSDIEEKKKYENINYT